MLTLHHLETSRSQRILWLLEKIKLNKNQMQKTVTE